MPDLDSRRHLDRFLQVIDPGLRLLDQTVGAHHRPLQPGDLRVESEHLALVGGRESPETERLGAEGPSFS